MKIKQGMVVGMGIVEVSLLVHVESVDGNTFVGHVINGNWNFVYDAFKHKIMFDPPSGKREVHESHILFVDPIPMSAGYHNYNDVIHYMNEHLSRPKVVSWFMQQKYNIARGVTTFYKRLKTSSQMFVRTWKQGSTDINYVEWDDDIPF